MRKPASTDNLPPVRRKVKPFFPLFSRNCERNGCFPHSGQMFGREFHSRICRLGGRPAARRPRPPPGTPGAAGGPDRGSGCRRLSMDRTMRFSKNGPLPRQLDAAGRGDADGPAGNRPLLAVHAAAGNRGKHSGATENREFNTFYGFLRDICVFFPIST